VTGSDPYQWRFRVPAENVEILRTSTSFFLNLGWNSGVAPPLLNGKTYEVDVRASADGGITWYGYDSHPWGDLGLLTIGVSPAQGGREKMTSESTGGGVVVWPDPNNGEHVYISLDAQDEQIGKINVDMHDPLGPLVVSTVFNTRSDHLPTVMPIPNGIANGVYLVTVSDGVSRHTRRILISR
jgi:hypothetical protein